MICSVVLDSGVWQSDSIYIYINEKKKVKVGVTQFSSVQSLSHIQLFVILWSVTYQDTPPMEFSRQEYWSGLPLPSSGDLPNPGFEPGSPALHADSLPSELPEKPIYAYSFSYFSITVYYSILNIVSCDTQ